MAGKRWEEEVAGERPRNTKRRRERVHDLDAILNAYGLTAYTVTRGGLSSRKKGTHL